MVADWPASGEAGASGERTCQARLVSATARHERERWEDEGLFEKRRRAKG